MNIQLPRVPDVKNATGYAQVDPSTGTAPFRAMQGLGQQVSQAAGVLKQFDEKKKALKSRSAMAQLELESMRAQADIEEHVTRNPNDPASYKQFAKERMAKVLDGVDRKDLPPEALQQINDQFRLRSERTQIGAATAATKREIAIANDSLFQLADTQFRNGRADDSWKTLQDANVPQEVLTQKAEEIYGAGLYDLAREDLNQAEANGVEAIDEYIARLKKKGPKPEDSRYDFPVYEDYEVQVNGQPVAGLDQPQRNRLNGWAEGRKRSLEVKARHDAHKALDEIKRGEDPSEFLANPNIDQKTADFIESVQAAEIEGQGEGEPVYEDLANRIADGITAFETGDPLTRDEMNELWTEVKDGDLNRSARIELGKQLTKMESWAASVEKQPTKRRWWWADEKREIAEHEREAKQTLIDMTQGAFRLIESRAQKDLPASGLSRAYLKVLELIEKDVDAGLLTPETLQKYRDTEIPTLYRKHILPEAREALDAELENIF